MSSKFWSIILFFLVSGLIGCGGAVATSNPTNSATATKVVPVFKALATPTRYRYPTGVAQPQLYENQVDALDFAFYPEVITVTVGTSVYWLPSGEEPHNVVSVDHTWGVAVIDYGGFFKHTFTRAGIYEYVCSFHIPGMRGTVVVVPK